MDDILRRFRGIVKRMVAFNPDAPIAAHRHCSLHRAELEDSAVCGCFYCFAIFPAKEILEWIDDNQTALCPRCTIDSVIGSKSGYPVTKEFLQCMHDRWF
jgi:hypothetical protein